jgi:hypothetical protein
VDHGVEQVDPRRRGTVEGAEGQHAHGLQCCGMGVPRLDGDGCNLAEPSGGFDPDEIARQLADRWRRTGRESAELLRHRRQVIDDGEHAPSGTRTRQEERLRRETIDERGLRP